MEVILASNNKGKIAEFKAFLAPYNITVLSMGELGIDIDIVEDGDTFFANALIKAKTIYDLTHKPVISDDSGICCLGLGGLPGVYSARYGNLSNDAERRKFLLDKLHLKSNRQAYFHCSIVFYLGDNLYQHFVGECHGYIGTEEKGDNGFGYDSIFYQSNGKSFAEIPQADKFKISHRGIAMRKFKEYIEYDFSY